MRASGLSVRRLVGAQIEPRHWDAFYTFYCDTAAKKGGQAYLNRGFFSLLGQRMAESVMLVIAEDARGRPVAGALNVIGDTAIYGRNWGCLEEYRHLHFELCYYQASAGRHLSIVQIPRLFF